MTWLSENYKWLFDGIGALVVMAFLGYVARRILQDRPKQGAALTAQGAEVTNSPVASGTGITQTVNSPTTINVSLPAASPLTPLEFFNWNGSSAPLNVSGRQASVQDPSLVDLWCLVTIVNNTHYPMKIDPRQLFLDGVDWPTKKVFFRPRSNPLDRFDRISVMGNHKEDYELHFMFPVADCPKARSGYLLVETHSGHEPIKIEVRFPHIEKTETEQTPESRNSAIKFVQQMIDRGSGEERKQIWEQRPDIVLEWTPGTRGNRDKGTFRNIGKRSGFSLTTGSFSWPELQFTVPVQVNAIHRDKEVTVELPVVEKTGPNSMLIGSLDSFMRDQKFKERDDLRLTITFSDSEGHLFEREFVFRAGPGGSFGPRVITSVGSLRQL